MTLLNTLKITLLAFAVTLIAAPSIMAYDQPWNGYREDITDDGPPPPPGCEETGQCPQCDDDTNTSSPVYTAKGYLVWHDTDIQLAADTRLALKRTYNSNDFRAGLFGRGWVTNQETSIARTYKAITEGAADGSPTTATDFKSIPILLTGTGMRFPLIEEGNVCKTPAQLFFQFEKQSDGNFKKVYEVGQSYEVYSPEGRLLQQYSDDDGNNLYYEYDNDGRLVKQFDSDGYAFDFSYNDQGFVSDVKDNANRVWSYTYDEYGRLVQVLDPDGNTRDYTYVIDDKIGYKQHLLTAINDNSNDPVLSVEYDEITLYNEQAMRVKNYTGIDGKQHNYAYSETTFESNPVVKVRKTTWQVGTQEAIDTHDYWADPFTYRILRDDNVLDNTKVLRVINERGKTTETKDERDNVTQYEYNDAGYETKMTEFVGRPEEKVTTTTYLENTSRPTIINQYGESETTFTYDADLRMTSEIQKDIATGAKREWKYTYYPNTTDAQGTVRLGKVKSVDGPQIGSQDTQTFTYNDRGQLIQINLPENETIKYTYNAVGQRISLIATNNVTTVIEYNSKNRVIKTTQNGRIASYLYDSQDQMISMTDPLNRVTQFTYTNQNKLDRITYPAGDYLQYNYIYSASGTEVTKSYHSEDGALISKTILLDDSDHDQMTAKYLHTTGLVVSEHEYDQHDQVTKTIHTGIYDGASATSETSYTYDYQGRLTQVRDGRSGITNTGYDNFDRITSLKDANGGETEYVYSVFGNLNSLTSPDTGNTLYQYDNVGNLIERVNANNLKSKYEYDGLNRVKSIDYEGTNFDVTLQYGEGGYGKGLLTNVSDGSGSSNYIYDDRSLVTQVNTIVANTVLNTRYNYNDAGQLRSITYPSGLIVNYQYDSSGRLMEVSIIKNNIPQVILKNITWKGQQLVSYEFSNGIVTTMEYDASGRLTTKEYGSENNKLTNALDNQGNIIEQNWTLTGANSSYGYRYDKVNRLIQETDQAITYEHDSVGNRTNKIENGESISYDYQSNSNRLTEAGNANIERDDIGNTVSDENRNYQYDAMNRLSQITNSILNIQATYTYNYKGQRVRKQLSGDEILDRKYIYGLSGELLGEYDSDGNVIKEYIYIDQELVTLIDNNNKIIAIHTDHLMTPRLASDEDATMVWSWKSDPFGNFGVDNDLDGDGVTTDIQHRFPGQYYDNESGLHYNHHRYYDPSLGRYITSDPIGLDGGMNTYSYVENNPIKFFDFNGLSKAECIKKANEWEFNCKRMYSHLNKVCFASCATLRHPGLIATCGIACNEADIRAKEGCRKGADAMRKKCKDHPPPPPGPGTCPA